MWKDLGGAHAKMVQHPTVHLDDLWTLADITQQLYLSGWILTLGARV